MSQWEASNKNSFTYTDRQMSKLFISNWDNSLILKFSKIESNGRVKFSVMIWTKENKRYIEQKSKSKQWNVNEERFDCRIIDRDILKEKRNGDFFLSSSRLIRKRLEINKHREIKDI